MTLVTISLSPFLVKFYQEGQYVCPKNINRAIKNNTVQPRC